MTQPRSAIIIGAGASGLFTAKRLTEQGVSVTLLEIADHVGGQCNTFTDPKTGKSTEMGALYLLQNYGYVIDELASQKAALSRTVHTDVRTLDIYQTFQNKSLLGKVFFAVQFPFQAYKFSSAVKFYQRLRDQGVELPVDFEKPFAAFAKKHKLQLIDDAVKSIGSGFGYGPTTVCPSYLIMEYLGKTTLPLTFLNTVFPTVAVVTKGYQGLMTDMAKKYNVITSANVIKIDRSDAGVTVTYQDKENKIIKISADLLSLSISPQHWEKLGLEPKGAEQSCMDNVTYYRYPVIVCKLHGFPAKYRFFPDAYQEKGLGHLALVTTEDADPKTKDRLCTAYVNLKQGDTAFTLDENSEDYKKIVAELQAIPGVTKVEILQTKIWPDYTPALPWLLRVQLEHQQMKYRTLYTGPYVLGGFSDVACVAASAIKTVNKHVFHQITQNTFRDQIRRSFEFMKALTRKEKRVAPESDIAGHVAAFADEKGEVTVNSIRKKLQDTPLSSLKRNAIAVGSVFAGNMTLNQCPFSGIKPAHAPNLLHPPVHTGFYKPDGNLDHERIDAVMKKYAREGKFFQTTFNDFLNEFGINKRLTPHEYGALFDLLSEQNGKSYNAFTRKDERFITPNQIRGALGKEFGAIIDSTKKPKSDFPHRFKPIEWCKTTLQKPESVIVKPQSQPVRRFSTKTAAVNARLFKPSARVKVAGSTVAVGLRKLLLRK